MQHLGIDARALEQDPFAFGAGWGLVEIAEGPIRWVEYSEYGTCLYVPDARIGPIAHILPDFPFVALTEEGTDPEGVPWQEIYSVLRQRDRDSNERVAERLAMLEAHHVGVGDIGRDLVIWVLPGDGVEGWWCLEWDDRRPEWTRALWDRLEALAQCLLATPIPTGE